MTKDIIIKIPAFIQELSDINRTEKEVLAQIHYWDNDSNCTATNKTLAKAVGKTPRTVQRILKKLADLGYITKDIQFFFQRTIKTLLEDLKDSFKKAKKEFENKAEQIKSSFKKANKKPIKKHNLDICQRDNETLEDFETRCSEREALGDVILRKHYFKAPRSQDKSGNNPFLEMKRQFLRKFK